MYLSNESSSTLVQSKLAALACNIASISAGSRKRRGAGGGGEGGEIGEGGAGEEDFGRCCAGRFPPMRPPINGTSFFVSP